MRTINKILSNVCRDDDSEHGFPFSQEVGGKMYDCGTNGHIALLIETSAPNYVVRGPNLTKTLELGKERHRYLMLPGDVKDALAKAEKSESGVKMVRLVTSEFETTVNADYLADVLPELTKKGKPVVFEFEHKTNKYDGPLGAIIIRSEGQERRYLAALMPMRADEGYRLDLRPGALQDSKAA